MSESVLAYRTGRCFSFFRRFKLKIESMVPRIFPASHLWFLSPLPRVNERQSSAVSDRTKENLSAVLS